MLHSVESSLAVYCINKYISSVIIHIEENSTEYYQILNHGEYYQILNHGEYYQILNHPIQLDCEDCSL